MSLILANLNAILTGIINTLAAHVPYVQEYTTAGVHNWTPPVHAVLHDVFLVGGGGGGDGGAWNQLGGGGGGGGSGFWRRGLFLASDFAGLTAPLQIIVGAGGIGGSGTSAVATDQIALVGGATSLGRGDMGFGLYTILQALGGFPGKAAWGGRGHAGGGGSGVDASTDLAAGSGELGYSGVYSYANAAATNGGAGGSSAHRALAVPLGIYGVTGTGDFDKAYGGSNVQAASHTRGVGYGSGTAGVTGALYGTGGKSGTGAGAGGGGGGERHSAGSGSGGNGGADGYLPARFTAQLTAETAISARGGAGTAGLPGYARIITYRGRVPP